VTTYYHNGVLPQRVVDPLNHVSLTEYNEYSEIICETNELGYKTRYEFDERGNKTRHISPDVTSISLAYDEKDNLTEVIDKIGNRWACEYYDNNQLASKTDPLNNKLRYEYHHGLLSVVEDNSGNPIFFKYDQNLNLRSISDDSGNQLVRDYDALGNLLISKENRGTRRYYYDKLNRITRVDEADGNQRIFVYDAGDNIIHARDQQYDVSMQYRGMGRMVSRSQAGTTVKFEYNREEQLIAITNEHGRAYQFEWNANEELVAESGFDGLVRQFIKDPAGRTIRINRPDQRYSLFTYDALDRITQIHHSDGSSKIFKYRADGELLEATNNFIKLRWELDPLGRITKEHQGEFWIASDYDSLGYRVRIQSSLGLDQRIERNARGDVLKISTGADQFEAIFRRDAQGLEIQRSLPGGIQSRWARDKFGRPIRHEIQQDKDTHSSRNYQWGLNNRLLKLIDSLNRETVFQHDALGNLLSARYNDNTFDLRMPDAVGNLFKTIQQKDREYGPAGQLLAIHSAKGTTRYHYDAEGNLIRKIEPGEKIWRYEWNGEGMMAKVIRPDGKEITFEYDAFGRRIRKIFNKKMTRWIWDGHNPLHEWVEYKTHDERAQSLTQLQTKADDIAVNQRLALLQEIDSQGPPKTFNDGTNDKPVTWLFEPDSFAPMAKLVGDEHYSIISDHLGTPNLIFDKNGNQVWSADISVWGELRNLRGEKDFCPFRFPGQYEDSETGLYYNRFRYFDPEAGQYTSQDPIALVGGAALYAYVGNPSTCYDPFGLSCKSEWNQFQERTKGLFKSRKDAAIAYRKMKDVSAIAKGSRDEDIRKYLPDSYIDEHARRFNDEGGAFIVIESWTTGGRYPTLPPRKFVGLRSEMDKVVDEFQSSGDWRVLRDKLNLGDTVDLSGDRILYVKIQPGDPRFRYEIPHGNEAGVIPGEWVPGGFTKSGTQEAALVGSEAVNHGKTLAGFQSNFPDSDIIKS
jgi:RHS repeat-associated protein